MPIEHTPFVAKTLTEDRDQTQEVVSLKLNREERDLLNRCKLILHQEKDGTAIKQLMQLGSQVLHDPKTGLLINTIFENNRRNKRLGIGTFG